MRHMVVQVGTSADGDAGADSDKADYNKHSVNHGGWTADTPYVRQAFTANGETLGWHGLLMTQNG